MKELLFFISACIVSIACATSVNCNMALNKEPKTETTPSERKSGYCDCGGKLTTDFKAIVHKKTCVSCGGKGTLGQGKNKVTCTLCKGTGTIEEYETAYRCTSCGSIYKNW